MRCFDDERSVKGAGARVRRGCQAAPPHRVRTSANSARTSPPIRGPLDGSMLGIYQDVRLEGQVRVQHPRSSRVQTGFFGNGLSGVDRMAVPAGTDILRDQSANAAVHPGSDNG
jgi:hypothetical protein